MMGYERSDDYQPLFYVQGRPVHVTTLLVAVHLASFVAACLLRGLTGFNLPLFLAFSSDMVIRHGALWQIVTYNFAHLPGNGLFFVLDMVFLFIWGRQVEQYFGRKTFAALYGALVLVAPAYLLLRAWLSFKDPVPLFEGSNLVDFGVFLLFVTIYPNVQFWFGIAAKWYAYVFVAIWTLDLTAGPDLRGLALLWLTVGTAFFGARYASMGSEAFDVLGNLRERFPRKVVPSGVKPRLKPRRAVDAGGGDDYRDRDVHESIDPLLDKISKQGIGSLTSSERATLERARVSLLRKEKGD